MALDDSFNITRPGQNGGTGDIDALHIEEYTGVVHATIERRSVITPFIPTRSVKGTSVFSNNAVGESTLQKVVPGTQPDGTVNKFAKKTLTIDTTILARSAFPLLETWQTQYDARQKVGVEHGKKHAKFRDQAFFIQALKAAKATDTFYTGVSGAGHFGGSQVTLGASGDATDPAKMYAAICDLIQKMQEKDVDPLMDGVILATSPAVFNTLSQAELLINQTYVTSQGNSVAGSVLKSHGCPILTSMNLPVGQTISSHYLSNADNSNAYDGDFTKDLLVAFAPEALMAGETIAMTTNVEWVQSHLAWLVDAYCAFAVGPDRAEYAGVISKP